MRWLLLRPSLLSVLLIYVGGVVALAHFLPDRCLSHWAMPKLVEVEGWTPDGKVIALATVDEALEFRDPASGRKLGEVRLPAKDGEEQALRDPKFSPDGSLAIATLWMVKRVPGAVSRSSNAQGVAVAVPSGQILETWSTLKYTFWEVLAFAPSGQFLLLRVVDQDKGQLSAFTVVFNYVEMREVARWPGRVRAWAFNPDSSQVAVYYDEPGTVELRDWPSGTLKWRLSGWPRRKDIDDACLRVDSRDVLFQAIQHWPIGSSSKRVLYLASAPLTGAQPPQVRKEEPAVVFLTGDGANLTATTQPGSKDQGQVVEVGDERGSAIGQQLRITGFDEAMADGYPYYSGKKPGFKLGLSPNRRFVAFVTSINTATPVLPEWLSWLSFAWLRRDQDALPVCLRVLSVDTGREVCNKSGRWFESFSPDGKSFVTTYEKAGQTHLELWPVEPQRAWPAILGWPLLPAIMVGMLGAWWQRRKLKPGVRIPV